MITSTGPNAQAMLTPFELLDPASPSPKVGWAGAARQAGRASIVSSRSRSVLSLTRPQGESVANALVLDEIPTPLTKCYAIPRAPRRLVRFDAASHDVNLCRLVVKFYRSRRVVIVHGHGIVEQHAVDGIAIARI